MEKNHLAVPGLEIGGHEFNILSALHSRYQKANGYGKKPLCGTMQGKLPMQIYKHLAFISSPEKQLGQRATFNVQQYKRFTANYNAQVLPLPMSLFGKAG